MPGRPTRRVPRVHSAADPELQGSWGLVRARDAGKRWMDNLITRIFLFELRLQCAALLSAASDLSAAERTPIKMPRYGFGLTDPYWFALQHLLVAAANISKLLWGSGGKKGESRKDLRTSIGVTDASPLRDPDLRNDFEHIDNEIETYFSAQPSGNYMGRNVGAGIKTADGSDFGHYDPATGEVTFFSHTVNVPRVVEEARTIQARVEEALAISLGLRRVGASPAPYPRRDPPPLSDPPTAEELRAIGLDPDYEIRPPGAPPRFPKKRPP